MMTMVEPNTRTKEARGKDKEGAKAPVWLQTGPWLLLKLALVFAVLIFIYGVISVKIARIILMARYSLLPASGSWQIPVDMSRMRPSSRNGYRLLGTGADAIVGNCQW